MDRSLRRNDGRPLSTVKSIHMDDWSPQQMERMRVGGNQQCRDWLEQHGLLQTVSPKEKYNHPAAILYADVVIPARIDGRPEPKSLEEYNNRHSLPTSTAFIPSWIRQLVSDISVRTLQRQQPGTTNFFQKHPQSNSLLRRIHKTITSSDFYMTAYVVTLVGLPVVFLLWRYGWIL